MDTATLVNINLVVQLLLVGIIIYAGYLARKRQLVTHCKVMRIAIGVQLLAIVALMTPRLFDLAGILPISGRSGFEMWLHHSLGLLVVGLWVFINLVVAGKIKFQGRLIAIMRLAFFSWLATLLLGLDLLNLIWGRIPV